MFQIDQLVIYGVQGACKIVSTEIRKVERKNIEYFVLESVQQPGSCYYIPTQNPTALSKLRPIITIQELDRCLNDPIDFAPDIFADENTRKQKYREWIASSQFHILFSATRAVLRYRNIQLLTGRKLHLCDESFLKDAEKILCGEISAVLSVSLSDARNYLYKHVNYEETVCM